MSLVLNRNLTKRREEYIVAHQVEKPTMRLLNANQVADIYIKALLRIN
jgi:hypothetical protein